MNLRLVLLSSETVSSIIRLDNYWKASKDWLITQIHVQSVSSLRTKHSCRAVTNMQLCKSIKISIRACSIRIVQCVNCQFLLEKIWNYKNITKFKKVFLTDNEGKKDLMHLFRVPREEMEATTEEYALLRQRVNNDLTIK